MMSPPILHTKQVILIPLRLSDILCAVLSVSTESVLEAVSPAERFHSLISEHNAHDLNALMLAGVVRRVVYAVVLDYVVIIDRHISLSFPYSE